MPVCVRAQWGQAGAGMENKQGRDTGQTSTCLHTQVLPLFRYKDGSLICQAGEPGKYRIDSKYGVHTLEINR